MGWAGGGVVGAAEANSRAVPRGFNSTGQYHIQLLLTGRNRFETAVARYLKGLGYLL